MADLFFTTKGQAEALAAQEALRKKALETKQEFEEAAKSTGTWDASMAKLKSSAETALRSISTEQEKIVDKIAKIEAAQEKGLIPPPEAEKAMERLRQQWVDIDQATVDAARGIERARVETQQQEAANAKLKSTAESALRSIQTEEEKILQQIEEIEDAMAKGLVPPDEAQEGLERLNDKLGDIRENSEQTATAGNKIAAAFGKAFDPKQLAGMVAGFVGVKAIIGQLREEFEDLQTAVDKRIAANLGPKAQGDQLAAAAVAMDKAYAVAQDRHKQRSEAFEKAKQNEGAAELGSPARARAHAETEEAKEAWIRSIDDVNAAQDVATAAARERDQFMATPEYRKAAALDARKKIPEQLHADLAQLGDATQLTTEELEKLADSFREAGQGVLARKLMNFISRLDDGTVAVEEVQRWLTEVAEGVRGTTGDKTVTAGGEVFTIPGRPRTDSEISPGEKEQIRLLEEANRLYEENLRLLRDGGIFGENK